MTALSPPGKAPNYGEKSSLSFLLSDDPSDFADTSIFDANGNHTERYSESESDGNSDKSGTKNDEQSTASGNANLKNSKNSDTSNNIAQEDEAHANGEEEEPVVMPRKETPNKRKHHHIADSNEDVAADVVYPRMTRTYLKNLSNGSLSSEPEEKPETKKKTTKRRSKVVERDEEDEDDSDESYAEKKKPKRKKRRGGVQSFCNRNAVATSIPVNLMPFILEKVLRQLPKDQLEYYDLYEIQNLVVLCALDDERFSGDDAEEEILRHVYETVKEEPRYHKLKRACNGHIDASLIGEDDARVLKRYNEFMNTTEQQELRKSFRNDDAHRHVWTSQEIKKFEEAFKLYGNGPTSNRKIAESIGNGVHPNHVAYLKQQIRKQNKKAKKEGLEENTKASEIFQSVNKKEEAEKKVDWNNPEWFLNRKVDIWYADVRKYYRALVKTYNYGTGEYLVSWEVGNEPDSEVDLLRDNFTKSARNQNRWNLVGFECP